MDGTQLIIVVSSQKQPTPNILGGECTYNKVEIQIHEYKKDSFVCTFFVSKSTRLPTPNLYLRMSLLFQLFDIFGRRTVEL